MNFANIRHLILEGLRIAEIFEKLLLLWSFGVSQFLKSVTCSLRDLKVRLSQFLIRLRGQFYKLKITIQAYTTEHLSLQVLALAALLLSLDLFSLFYLLVYFFPVYLFLIYLFIYLLTHLLIYSFVYLFISK